MNRIERTYIIYKAVNEYLKGDFLYFIAAMVILMILGFAIRKTGIDKLIIKLYIIAILVFSGYLFIKGLILLMNPQNGNGGFIFVFGGGILFATLGCIILTKAHKVIKNRISKSADKVKERENQ